MQIQFKLNLGGMEFTVIESADTHAEFIEKVSFFSDLPKVGPNGEDDLRFVHRQTKEGHNYYSLISDLANKEYKLGQSQKNPGALFGKGWEDKYVPVEDTTQVATATGFGQQPVTQQAPVTQQVQQPVVNQAAQVVQQQVVQQPVQQQVVQQPVVNQAVPTTAPTVANQAVANDVLSQFGIK